MRNVYLFTAFIVVMAVSILGFRGSKFTRPPMDVFPDLFFPGMKVQPKVRTEGTSVFFADGRADRLPPPGVVPASEPLRLDNALYLGKNPDGSWVAGFPSALTVDMAFLRRGRERYMITCSPCHGAVGDGNGITKRYGMGTTANYHDDRLRKMPEGQIFNTITNGLAPAYNMPPYADKLTPEDRWAVIAYVRALQRAQTGTPGDVPPDHKSELGLK